jgi:hypothetical protein
MQPDLDFYSTSAQVVPVLMLTIVFELHQERSSEPGWDLLVAATALLVLVGAEAAALHVLSSRDPADGAHGVITAGYVVGSAAIVLAVARPRMKTVPWLEERAWARVLAWVVWIAALWGILRAAGVS